MQALSATHLSGKSFFERLQQPGRMSVDELDDSLAEARPCAQLLCDKLKLALCFEETRQSSPMCKSMLPNSLPANSLPVLHMPDVEKAWLRPVLYYVSVNYMPRKVLMLSKSEFRTVADLRALWKKCDCRRDAVEAWSQAHSMFLPLARTSADMMSATRLLDWRRFELAAYGTLFELLSDGRSWIAVCNSKSEASGWTFELLDGHVQEFSSKEELELKLNVHCPVFEKVVV